MTFLERKNFMKYLKNVEYVLALLVVIGFASIPFFISTPSTDYGYASEAEEVQDGKRDFSAVLPAKVVSVYDGDTVKVQFTTEFNIRMLDCWAPEVKTKDPDEKRRGIEAKKYLETLLKPGDEVVLEIPYDGKIGDSVSLGRFLAKVYKDNNNISELMVKSGYAKATKK